MVIQHNLAAINVHRQMGINNHKTAMNLEKLSSGFRVNHAADDAAGLAISEKMRGQIRGMSMAEQNVRHAVNLLQTAEGGMHEIHSILNRMRELSVQSANGTYQDSDRNLIELEFQSLKGEVDRIANYTQYNKIKLLNVEEKVIEETPPPLSEYEVTVGPYEMLFYGWIEVKQGESFYVGVADWTISNENWPDLNIFDPMGQEFGYMGDYLSIDAEGNVAAPGSCDNAWYTGFSPLGQEEEFRFTNITATGAGRWNIWIKNTQGSVSTTFRLYSDKLIYPKDYNPDPGDGGNQVIVGNAKLPIQCGANGEDFIMIDRYDCRAEKIGISTLSVSTRDEANTAIEGLDAAVRIISGYRATCGAQMNLLEHTLNNLGVTKENLTAAESSIRDVDMAKEMMLFTKNNILIQATQAMLAQANQIPQGVLSLLQ